MTCSRNRSEDGAIIPPTTVRKPTMERTSEESLKLLTEAVWQAYGNEGACPPEKYLEFRQLDDLISTTAWGDDARNEFFRRWAIVEKANDKSFDGVSSFAQLAHLVWEEAEKTFPEVKHPLAPLIHAWHSGPVEVLPVRDANGHLRGDTICRELRCVIAAHRLTGYT